MFKLGRVPVRVFPGFWFMAGIASLEQHPSPWPFVRCAAVLLAAVLVEEWAHALALQRLGYAPRIWLHYLGGETFVATPKPSTVGKLTLAYLAGPAAGLALAGLGLVAYQVAPLDGFADVARVSGGWAIANLLPLQPLSGGKVVTAALTRPLGRHVKWVSHLISLVTAFALLVLVTPRALAFKHFVVVPLAGRWPLFAVVVLFLIACLAIAQLRDAFAVKTDQAAMTAIADGYRALNDQKDAGRAISIARCFDREGEAPHVRARAKELLAWAHLVEENPEAAERAILRMPAGQEPDSFLEGCIYLALQQYSHAATFLSDAFERAPDDVRACQLAHALVKDNRLAEALPLADHAAIGAHTLNVLTAALFFAARYDEALRLEERSWALKQDPRTAFNLACTFARLGRIEEGAAWVGRAVDSGWRDLHVLDSDTDLEPLRKHPLYHEARARLTSLGRAPA
jgi:tetratricopeptide (TPR) repeat protein